MDVWGCDRKEIDISTHHGLVPQCQRNAIALWYNHVERQAFGCGTEIELKHLLPSGGPQSEVKSPNLRSMGRRKVMTVMQGKSYGDSLT